MTWFVTRNPDGTIAMKHRDGKMCGSTEALADNDPAIVAFDAAVATAAANQPPDPLTALMALLVQKGTITQADVTASPSLSAVAASAPAGIKAQL